MRNWVTRASFAAMAAMATTGCEGEGATVLPAALLATAEGPGSADGTPEVTVVAPQPWHLVRAGGRVRFEATVAGAGETRSCFFDKDDGDLFASIPMEEGAPRCVHDELFRFPGVYTASLQYDDPETPAAATVPVVVYDPAAGWVTGYGLVDSPAGAVARAPAAAGPARFLFFARYLGEDGPPAGAVLFEGPDGFRFQSLSLHWLVLGNRYGTIEPADTASIAGTGTSDGQPCAFLLLSNGHRPGERSGPDGVRLRITCGGAVAYDNASGPLDPDQTSFGAVAGSIVNHPRGR